MLKLLRRKSFRKSKDLNSENCFTPRSSTGATSGQYSVSVQRQHRQRRSSSGLQVNLSGDHQDTSSSLDRRRQSEDGGGRLRSLSTKSVSASVSNSENPPEIIQYSRPPENLSSPVRHSNTLIHSPDSPNSLNVSYSPGCDTTLQKLFYESVVNDVSRRSSSSERTNTGVDLNPNPNDSNSSGSKSQTDRIPASEVSRPSATRTESVIIRDSVTGSASTSQPHPYIRRSSDYNNSDHNNHKHGDNKNATNQNKSGRRSVMTVLRQSFRKSKKDRPVITPKSTPSHNRVSYYSGGVTSPVRRSSVASRTGSIDDQNKVSVASVRASRTLTPSRVSIVSRASSGLGDKDQSIDTDQGVKYPSCSSSSKLTCDNNNQTESVKMKTGTETAGPGVGGVSGVYQLSSNHVGRVSNSKHPSYSDQSTTTPTATPRQGGQRFLPETPKLTTTASAVPPIYANVHQQLAPGNNRQLTPGIAKILEENGTKRQENGHSHARSSSSSNQGVSRSPSSSTVTPASIPKPAARMSLRQKVEM